MPGELLAKGATQSIGSEFYSGETTGVGRGRSQGSRKAGLGKRAQVEQNHDIKR